MGIARSTYYRETEGSADDTALVEAMHAIKGEFEAYGWRRMQAALRHRGWIVNHKKIKRLMREHAMHPPRRYIFTPSLTHSGCIARRVIWKVRERPGCTSRGQPGIWFRSA